MADKSANQNKKVNKAKRGSANNPLPEQENTYAQSSNGLGYEQEQVQNQEQEQGNVTSWVQGRGNISSQMPGQEHPAGQVPGQSASQAQGEEQFTQVSGIEGYYGGTTQQEQEGQKVNVEQSHRSNTAQYKGKPGAKAPTPGQEQGTAWSQDMEMSNSDVPARNPNAY